MPAPTSLPSRATSAQTWLGTARPHGRSSLRRFPAGGDPGEGDDGRDLASALARLPRSQREALELRYGEGLAVGEVGAVLGMSRFAASRAISSALEALRADLGVSKGERGDVR